MFTKLVFKLKYYFSCHFLIYLIVANFGPVLCLNYSDCIEQPLFVQNLILCPTDNVVYHIKLSKPLYLNVSIEGKL